MNTTDRRPLAPYEERLLAELRQVVADRAIPAGSVVRARVARPGMRVTVGLAAAAAIAVVAGISAPALLGAGERPAYAAERNPDGSISIYIREWRDAKGLQDRLRQLGVTAVVDYVPNGKQCREPRATYLPWDEVPRDLFTSPPPKGEEEAYFILRADLIEDGQTLVFTTTLVGDPDKDESWSGVTSMELATGTVAECELVPGPEYPRNGG